MGLKQLVSSAALMLESLRVNRTLLCCMQNGVMIVMGVEVSGCVHKTGILSKSQSRGLLANPVNMVKPCAQ